MEAVSRAGGLTDIDRRVFCPLTYAQAILNHCFGHKNDQWWYEYDVGCGTRQPILPGASVDFAAFTPCLTVDCKMCNRRR